MNILGVDPGLGSTGYGVIQANGNRITIREGGAIRGGPSSIPLELGFNTLYDALSEVLLEYSPSAVAVEQIYSHYNYPATAVIMGHARGVIALAAAKARVPLFNYSSTQVKHVLVGHGRASKIQVQKAIQARLKLTDIPEPNDVADALALAVCHWQISSGAQIISDAMGADHKLRRPVSHL